MSSNRPATGAHSFVIIFLSLQTPELSGVWTASTFAESEERIVSLYRTLASHGLVEPIPEGLDHRERCSWIVEQSTTDSPFLAYIFQGEPGSQFFRVFSAPWWKSTDIWEFLSVLWTAGKVTQ